MAPVRISYFSDVLCIWAYAAQRRLDQLVERFGDEIVVENHYCSVFPDAWKKIETSWEKRGGFEGFSNHLNEVARKFPHIEVYDKLWLDCKPRTSASAHLFLKAIEIIEREQPLPAANFSDRLSTRAAWMMRLSFFASALDISDWKIHQNIAGQLGLDYEQVQEKIRSSEAVAELAADYDLSQKLGIEGSPTFLMNDGRQKLFGNVGYRLIEANVQELLRRSDENDASWC